MNQQLRVELNTWLERIALKLNPQGWDILEVGIGGDKKPSGSYPFFGKGNNWTTLDIERRWKPDIEADICESGLEDDSFDLVIMTQTLEHIWDYRQALSEIQRIAERYAVIDCPFMFEFHSDKIRMNRDWEEWDDYWRFTPAAMNRLMKEAGFDEVHIKFSKNLTLCLGENYG